MEEKKKFIDPVVWAKHCFVLFWIEIAIISAWIVFGLTEKIFGHDNFSRALDLTLLFISYALLFVIFIGSSVTLFGLIIKKVRMKKPYVYAIISIAGCTFIFGSLLMKFRCRTIPRGYLCKDGLGYLSECILETSKTNNNKYQKRNWCDSIKDKIDFENPSKCPLDKTGPCSYALNENIPAGSGGLPADLVLLFESAPGWNQIGGPDDVVTDRHGKPGANIAFSDGHVEFIEPEDISTLRWTLDK